VEAYIRDAAAIRGIDPNVAVRVANAEGGTDVARRGTFETGSSWWPFQLHYGGKGYEHLGDVAGMGNTFTAATGFAVGDPTAWKAATDYALDRVATSGWGDWYGAKAQGITGFTGVTRFDEGGYLPPGVSVVSNQTGAPEAVLTPAQLAATRAGPSVEINLGGITISAPGGDAQGIGRAMPALAEELLRLVTPRLETALRNLP
jgi:hypothetical protein